ncbi:nucleotidyltransferase domain-containing protein [Bacillus sp. JJ1533]|uniref:nucleotidyltransferase domain-containing protein n=1 Tax=Bacillus sp. JJ1533 TaxID=3122959 RepID=UPI003000CC86
MFHINKSLEVLDIEVKKVAIIGSRISGYVEEESDLDIAVEYSGSEREDDVHHNLVEEPFIIDHIKVDFLPFWDVKGHGIGNRKHVMLYDDSYHF